MFYLRTNKNKNSEEMYTNKTKSTMPKSNIQVKEQMLGKRSHKRKGGREGGREGGRKGGR
jgi:hypothetical protein